MSAARLTALLYILAAAWPGAGSGAGARRAWQVGQPVRVLDQGEGDLGRRLDRVWRAAGTASPIAFFGADSPDVPDAALREIPAALAECDVAVGPVEDGGYWTLAARRYQPRLLAGIDWDPACLGYWIDKEIAPGGYAWVFPKGEGRANVGLGLQADLAETTALSYL